MTNFFLFLKCGFTGQQR